MFDYVGFGEGVVLGAELGGQLGVEGEVDVHLLVGRAVERVDIGAGVVVFG